MSVIVPLENVQEQAIDDLLDAAFGPDRHGRTAYRIRAGTRWLPHLSFAMVEEDGRLVGSLQSWPVALLDPTGGQTPLVMVGPVAVDPAVQGEGHGRALMDALVAAARARRADTLMMIGDPEYYGRFWGFSAEGTGEWDVPGPFERRRLLALSVDGRTVGGAGMLGSRVPCP